MKRLNPDFRFDQGFLESKLRSLAEDLGEREFDRDFFRGKLEENFEIRKLKPKAEEISFLAVDAALVKKELRHHALWATHSVVMFSRFDGRKHPDPLTDGSVLYSDLLYESYFNMGVFWPYRNVEARVNSTRVAEEYSSILSSLGKIEEKPDLLLLDGSMQTTKKKLRAEVKRSSFPEHKRAYELYANLLGAGKVAGLVEDSHSCDISKKLGLDVTNLALLELLLEENEYLAIEKDGVHVCHLKLPPKPLSYVHSGRGDPLTVRWEFSYPDFESDLNVLSGLWMEEDDIWHSQIYPMRVTDFLTRKIKLGAVLDSLIHENGLEPKYRDMRTD